MNVQPEHQFVLCCARIKLYKGNEDKIRKPVSDSLDWDYLLQTDEQNSRAHTSFTLSLARGEK